MDGKKDRWVDIFFFSSRRRHTRLQGDWSSDVCSSDLVTGLLEGLTSVDGGPLGVLTELVNGLTQVDGQALQPVIGTLNGLIAGLGNGLEIGRASCRERV